MLREPPLRRIEDDVLLVHSARARRNGPRPKLLQKAPEGLHVFNLQLDFSFARHAVSNAVAGYFGPPQTYASITNAFNLSRKRDL